MPSRIAFLLFTVVVVAGVVVHMAHASGHADGRAAPIFGVKIPPGYRDWRLVSVVPNLSFLVPPRIGTCN